MCWKRKNQNKKGPLQIPVNKEKWGSYSLFNINIFSNMDWEIRRETDKRLITNLAGIIPWFMATVIIDQSYYVQKGLTPNTYPNELATKYKLNFFITSTFDEHQSLTKKHKKYFLHILGRYNMELIHELMTFISHDHLQFVFYGLSESTHDWHDKVLNNNHVLQKIWFNRAPYEAIDPIRSDCELLFFIDEGYVFFVLDQQQAELANGIIEDINLSLSQD
jgi:hypothetical protein